MVDVKERSLCDAKTKWRVWLIGEFSYFLTCGLTVFSIWHFAVKEQQEGWPWKNFNYMGRFPGLQGMANRRDEEFLDWRNIFDETTYQEAEVKI